MRVAFVASQPTPYRIPIWEAMARQVEQLDVVFFTQREANRNWEADASGRGRYCTTVVPGFRAFVPQVD